MTGKSIANISLLLILQFLFCSTSSYAKIVDKIVAVVNDEVITQTEVDRVLYPMYLQYTQIYKDEEVFYEKIDETRMDILKQLVSDKLILSEAKKLNIAIDEKEIDARVEETKVGLLKDKNITLENLLNKQNMTLSELRAKYREQLMIQKTIDSQIKYKIEIQPSEVSKYYSDHVDDYTQHEQVAANTILIKLSSEQRTPIESHQLAEDVRKMALTGRDFRELALNYSEGPYAKAGGDIGFVNKGELLKEIDSVIFFLEVNDISEIIETPIGYHLFQIYDRKAEKILPFEDVRLKVMDAIYRVKAQREFEEWLEKLKANAYISIR
ncbi:MAG: peptidylprolyl isomerase [Candidatus Omnitrophica bacterium]|nr:peptidylprolyl isomerase [Candidatus Omnitrophota bacterium]